MKLYLKFTMFLKLSEMNYIHVVEPQDCQNFVNIPITNTDGILYVKTSNVAALV